MDRNDGEKLGLIPVKLNQEDCVDKESKSLLRTIHSMARGRWATQCQLVESVKEIADGLIGSVPEKVDDAKDEEPVGLLNQVQRELVGLDNAQQELVRQIDRLRGALQ